jgi:hypothetical protein
MTPAAALQCARCGVEMDACGFCDEPDCHSPICAKCVAAALHERMPQPHLHGG